MIQPLRAALGVATLMAFGAAPVQANTIHYVMSLPGLGSGSFTYNTAAIVDVGSGNWSAPLTAFSFNFSGVSYGLPGANSSLAWFMDPEQRFVGIQYITSSQPTDIEFSAGSGGGDMGLFSSTGLIETDPVALSDANFFLVPELDSTAAPSALLMLAGVMALSQERRRSRAA